MQIDLKCGAQIVVEESAINNMELVDLMAEGDVDNDIIKVSKMLGMLISKKDKKALYDAVRADNGTVPIEAVAEAIKEIFEAFKEPGKN